MAGLYNAFYLEHGGFDRDMRIETTAAGSNNIGWEQGIGGQVIFLAELGGVGLDAIIGTGDVVGMRFARDGSSIGRDLVARLERDECAVSFKQLWVSRSQIGAAGIAGVIARGAWASMKIFGAGKLLSNETGTNYLVLLIIEETTIVLAGEEQLTQTVDEGGKYYPAEQ